MKRVRWMPKDPRAAQIVLACHTLLPLTKVAKLVLRRTRMSAAELVPVVPGLAAWPAQNHFDARPLDVAIAIATGKNPYAIVKWLSGTRRTSEQIQKLYLDWRARQPRAKAA
ncbi:MAG TPA: hypothetical protein VL326_06375 [Kofleriaceae bacterium]|nr:hypothetical protein [Kofleriaceae bacterium]